MLPLGEKRLECSNIRTGVKNGVTNPTASLVGDGNVDEQCGVGQHVAFAVQQRHMSKSCKNSSLGNS
ncbi:hypothetical protein Y032_0055g2569 [Ancylostoma ceylanicum]|uniref:Uncharacterized protein n=1 Tax=Ancylostoma ceylanicum TaxID=53326 RepID=A0A016U7A2_9BILA|nr:hypothetical protein Y032_0055g2569 [Ancylostoma ceylanicum]